MQHHLSLADLSLDGAWVTIGSFDGVHRGHQVILNQMVHGAHAAGRPAVVVTFFPHPVVVLKGIQGPIYLTSDEERTRLLADLGVDHVVTLAFDQELASQTAGQFMQNLADHLHLSRLIVGYDFALGHGRQGNIPTLRQLGADLGYEVEVIAPSEINGGAVSSTRIRQLISQGQVVEATQLLGRWYRLSGKVVHGDGRGRSIGIPTANLSVWSERVIPATGVYATLASIHGHSIPSVTNIGLRPTFEANAALPRIEAFLIDYDEDLYGMNLQLDFIKFLRPEQRFSSPNALIEQIHQDILNAREVLPYVP